MTQTVLSNLTLRVNNRAVGYKPNTLAFKTGKGEISVKGVSIGAGLSDIAVSENVETFVGQIKFELYTTAKNEDLFKEWKEAPISTGNTVKIFGTDFTGTMTGAVVMNDPDMKTGVDESFEVTFDGNPIK